MKTYQLICILKKELAWRGFHNQHHCVITSGNEVPITTETNIGNISQIRFSGNLGEKAISVTIKRNRDGLFEIPKPYDIMHNTKQILDEDVFLYYRFIIVDQSLSIVSRGLESSVCTK